MTHLAQLESLTSFKPCNAQLSPLQLPLALFDGPSQSRQSQFPMKVYKFLIKMIYSPRLPSDLPELLEDQNSETLSHIYFIGYSLSLVALIVATTIFLYFK